MIVVDFIRQKVKVIAMTDSAHGSDLIEGSDKRTFMFEVSTTKSTTRINSAKLFKRIVSIGLSMQSLKEKLFKILVLVVHVFHQVNPK